MHILLVDDDPLLVAPLAAYLGITRPGWGVGTAGSGEEALAHLRERRADLAVVDLQMPGMDGMALLGAIREDPDLAGLPIILATGRSDRASMRNGMASGADDYLTKPYTGEELIEAIEARLRRTEAARALGEAADVKALRQVLTDRELEVLGLIGQGLVSKEIAERLACSPATVSVHRANIMRKLDLHPANALAALAVRAGLS